MFASIINDCKDGNAAGRQCTRAQSLFGCAPSFTGVEFGDDLGAAGNIVDMLDASGDAKGVILVNVAPRNGSAKKWPNGTPFGYFWYRDTLVVSSIDGRTLSLVKKLRIAEQIEVFDISLVIKEVVQKGLLIQEAGERIVNSQFRSYDFLPRAAAWLMEGKSLPTAPLPVQDVADAPSAVWWIDNFGNCKTTLLPEELDFQEGKRIETNAGTFSCYSRLKDVPDGEPALIIGSSGLEGARFLEVVVQGGDAAKLFGLQPGSILVDSRLLDAKAAQ